MPAKPKVEIRGEEGEESYYRSEVEIRVMANDRSNHLTYTIEGTGIKPGNVNTETSIGNGQAIKIAKDGTYTINIYEYNRDGKKSEPTTITLTRDTVEPTGTLEITKIQVAKVTVQLTPNDQEPSSGYATENPYIFYYQEEGSDSWIEAGKGSTSSYTYDTLEEGKKYNFKAEITDKAGNVGTSEIKENIQTHEKPRLEGITDWTKRDIKETDETSITITVTQPVKVADGKMPNLEPDSTGSTVRIEVLDPDENGYGTKIKVTVTGGNGDGEEAVVVPEGTLVEQYGETVETIRKEGITVDNTKPTIIAIGVPSKAYIKNGETTTYTITTSESVALADSTKCTVIGAGSTGCTVSITGSGTSWVATLTGGTGNGGVTLNLEEGLFKDTAGNTSIATTKTGLALDNTAPTMTVSPASGTVAKARNVSVTIGDTGSGLSSSANTTYYLSTDANNPTASGYQTGNYTSGTAFTIGTGLTGTYYLFLPVVADNVGNTSVATISGYYRCGTYIFDNTAPTVSNVVLDTVTTNGFKVTITASDIGKAGIKNYTIYYKTSSESKYSKVTVANKIYTFDKLAGETTYSVYVVATDNAGNVSKSSSIKEATTKRPAVENGTWDSKKEVNGPYLYAGLNPVIWVNGKEITKYTDPTNKTGIKSDWTANNGDEVWYDYKTGNGDHKSSQWANAVDTNGSYYVWIPRYAYKIIKPNSTEDAGLILVKFMKDKGSVAADGTNCTIANSNISTTTRYVVHPAFCTNVDLGGYGKELSGIWVAKYQACNVGNKPVSKPDTISWLNIKIGDCYTNSYNYNRSMDSHLIKNSEWRSSSLFST